MRRSSGFTLTEALIAVCLYAVVMTGLLSAFGSGIFCRDHVEGQLDSLRMRAQAISRLDLDARNAVAFSEEKSLFSGRKDAVSFFAEVDFFSDGKAGRDIARVSYRFSGGQLLRTCRRGKESLNEEAPGQAEEIWTGIRAGAFQYADNISATKPVAWNDTWDRPEGMPQAIRMDITPEEPAQRRIERVVYLRV